MTEKLGSYQHFSLPNITDPVACFMLVPLMQHDWTRYKFRQFSHKPVNLKPLIAILAPQIISSNFQKNLLLDSPIYPCPSDTSAVQVASRLQTYKLPRPNSIEQLIDFKKYLGLEPVSFRVTGCWMGSYDVKEANYVAPPPQFIRAMTQDVFEFLRSAMVPAHVASLLITLWIAKIHPFSDGNGKVLRSWLLCNGSYIDFVLACIMSTSRMQLIQLWEEAVNNEITRYIELFEQFALELNTDVIKFAYESKKLLSSNNFNNSTYSFEKYAHDRMIEICQKFLRVYD